jgi:hypothetical protein
MRKVLFKKWIPKEQEEIEKGIFSLHPKKGTNCFEKEYNNEGVFHQWCETCNKLIDGSAINDGETTAGIIEIEDGSIICVMPGNIKFIESFKPVVTDEIIEKIKDLTDNDIVNKININTPKWRRKK